MAVDIIYTLSGCPYCQGLMEECRRRGTPFEEICLSGGPALRQQIRERYGADRVPVVVRDGRIIQCGDASGGG